MKPGELPFAPRLDLDDARTSTIAKKAFFRVMSQWGVADPRARILLGSPSRSTFYSWKKGHGGKLPKDALERISYVLGIFKALEILFPGDAQADAWIARPNEAFAGQSAIERMAAGNLSDLHAVRSYLDYVRGGGS